ncbi:MAG: hypothetical protein QOI76_3034 [Frankiales bacterium]|nr:hypothetical protein [Frankiales bacterium]
MNVSKRAAIAVATTGLTLAMGMTPASASVSSGGGQLGFTTTICQESIYHYHGFEATARVRQEFEGQWVAVRFWTYDARGWRPTGDWSMTNNPGWSYDGVAFHGIFDGLQPVSGSAAWLYVQYAWYDNNGWRVGGELLDDYATEVGTHASYCII